MHFSTDFVFDGASQTPYRPGREPNPLSFYGASKLAGEQALADLVHALILRTAWLFGPGRDNFVAKILDLAQTR